MSLTQSADFKLAASFAKAVAELNEQAELTPLIFLSGVVLAFKFSTFEVEPTAIVTISDKLMALASDLKLDKVQAPVADKSFPLTEALKKAIGDNQKSSLNDLIITLARSLHLVSGTVIEPKTSVSLVTISEDPVFLNFDRYAKGLAKKYSIDTLRPELYALGALAALKRGELEGQPALSAHINAYAKEFNAWLDEQGWHAMEDFPETENLDAVNEQTDNTQPLHAYRDANNPLLALLNAGIAKVSETRDRECVAYHEAGHAIVSLALRPKVLIEKVTIVPNENYIGCVAYDETNPVYKHVFPCTREDYLEDLCVALAGQAAQLKKFGFNAADIGAQNDYAGATEYAWQYITEFGLDDAFGPIQLSILSKKYSIRSGWLFDEAQRRLQTLLKEAQHKTEILLEQNWDNVERVVQGLLIKKTLTEDEVRALMLP